LREVFRHQVPSDRYHDLREWRVATKNDVTTVLSFYLETCFEKSCHAVTPEIRGNFVIQQGEPHQTAQVVRANHLPEVQEHNPQWLHGCSAPHLLWFFLG